MAYTPRAPRWAVYKDGRKLGEVEAATQTAAATEAMRQFAALGLTARKLRVEKAPTE